MVLAAGAWSRPLGKLAGIDVPVAPYRRHIFVTKAFSGITRSTPMTVDFRSSFYFHPEGDTITFKPANRLMQPIIVRKRDFKSVDLLGIVVGVYRKLN